MPTLKEQGLDVSLVNWRGVFAPPQIRDKDKKALSDAIAKMVESPAWKDTLTKRGWLDLYQPADEFAAFLAGGPGEGRDHAQGRRPRQLGDAVDGPGAARLASADRAQPTHVASARPTTQERTPCNAQRFTRTASTCLATGPARDRARLRSGHRRPALAEIKGLEIIAPAGPGGGYDQLARATQEVLEKRQLASGVQVQNIPGAGGTIGLAQFVTKSARNPDLMVVGLGMVGAILTNKSPVTLEQVTPLARLTGEYQPLVVAADFADQDARRPDRRSSRPTRARSAGAASRSAAPTTSCARLIVKAVGGDVTKMNYIVAGAGGEMLAQVMGGHITVATGGLNEMAQQIQAGKLRALGISSPERLPGVDIPTFKEQGRRRRRWSTGAA